MATTPLKDDHLGLLKKMLDGPCTRQQLSTGRYDLKVLERDGFITRAGEGKNDATGGRKAVLYKLTAKGKRRAAK